jgi:hypothetical protein
MRKTWLIFFALNLTVSTLSYCQSPKSLIKSPKSLFKSYRSAEIPNNKFDEIFVDKDGLVLVSASEFSFVMITGGNTRAFTFGLDNQNYGIRNLKSVFTGAPIKIISESSEGYVFFSTRANDKSLPAGQAGFDAKFETDFDIQSYPLFISRNQFILGYWKCGTVSLSQL